MAKKATLAVRISFIISIMAASLMGLVTPVIGSRLSAAVADLVKDENLRIGKARAAELGRLMDKLHSQPNIVSATLLPASSDASDSGFEEF